MRFDRAQACCFLFLIAAGSACRAADPEPTIGFYKLDDQRLTGETTVMGKDGGFSDLSVLVTVDTTGKVFRNSMLPLR